MSNTGSRLIAMAVALVGSPERVRARMKCCEDEFLDYRAGKKEPDWVQLGRLVELIIAEHGKVIVENRAALTTMRARKRNKVANPS